MAEVVLVSGAKLAGSVEFLAEEQGAGASSQISFLRELKREVEAGRLEVLSAVVAESIVGSAVVSYRLAVSSGVRFASIEELVVKPGSRGKGVGSVLLGAVGERCAARGVSYVEVQAVDERAKNFYEACGYEVEDGVTVLSRSFVL